MTEFSLTRTLEHWEEGQRQATRMPTDSKESFLAWQTETRTRVREILHVPPAPQIVTAERVGERDRGEGLTETKWAVLVEGRTPVPAYELRTAETAAAKKAIIVLHGHNPNVQYCLGNYPDEETAKRFRAKDNNYAEALARAGYRVVAIEQQGFGERQSADPVVHPVDRVVTSCRDLSFRYMTIGKTLQGERVADTLAVMQWLRAQGVQQFAQTGNSGGGTTTLWTAAVSDEPSVLVPGSTFSSMEACIHGVYHCECNYVPGARQLLEAAEWAALSLPRPLCFVQGENDPLFPSGAAREEFARLREAYALFDATDRLDLRFHPGEHAYHHALAHDFLGVWF